MYICNVRINKQNINNKNKNSMLNQVMNSQSTEARNSANVVVKNIDNRANGGNYKWQVEKINIINEFFNAEFFSEDGLLEGAEVVIVVNENEVSPRLYVDGVVFWPKNMSCFKSSSKSERAMMAEMFGMAKDAALCMGDCENEYYPLSYPYVPWIDAYIAERNIESQWAAFNEAPSLEEGPSLEEAPCLDEKKILEDFCTNEASKIMAAGLTSVALTNEEFYMYDYESLYDYLVDAGFDSDRAYEIRDQYDEEVDRAIRGLLTAPDFVPVEVSVSDIESTERFWDDITMPYSAKGLAYVRENTSEVYMDDIIKEVAEFHWDFESVVKESRWTRFTNDSFRELIWTTCWAEYLVAHTDEALEAETRYVMDFDSVYDDLFGDLWPYMTSYDDSCGCSELWVDSWYVVERAAEIIEDSVADSDTRCIYWDEFPDYMMTVFLGDLYGFETFTERVMSELEGGDIVDILPYDDGLYLSFVNDKAEVAA